MITDDERIECKCRELSEVDNSEYLAIGITKHNTGSRYPIYTDYSNVSMNDPVEVNNHLLSQSDALYFDEILLIKESSVIYHWFRGQDY